MSGRQVVFRVHAIQRMFERRISEADVHHILGAGEAIENYPDGTPYPSQLLLGWREGRPLHLVAANNVADNQQIIITVYEPDSDQWEADFRRRKR